jgi:hypothetical protein
MNNMRKAVHVLFAWLRNPPLISLPPKAKCSKMPIPLTIVTMEPHLSLGWGLFVSFGIFGWLRGSRKGITRDVRKGIKCVIEVVRFRNTQLFFRRGSHRLLHHTISHRGDRLRWCDFDKLGRG